MKPILLFLVIAIFGCWFYAVVNTGDPHVIEINDNPNWDIKIEPNTNIANPFACDLVCVNKHSGKEYIFLMQYRWQLVAAYFQISTGHKVGYITSLNKTKIIYDWFYKYLDKLESGKIKI